MDNDEGGGGKWMCIWVLWVLACTQAAGSIGVGDDWILSPALTALLHGLPFFTQSIIHQLTEWRQAWYL